MNFSTTLEINDIKPEKRLKNQDKLVLLVSPASRLMNHYRPPLALMYISGYLKHMGIKTKIIDSIMKGQVVRDEYFNENVQQFFASIEDDIIRQINDIDTDVIGITCYTPEVDEVERLAKKIKAIKPNVKIVAGGIHPTLYPDDLLGPHSDIDFVIFGEGEITMLELVRELRTENQDMEKLKGVGFYDHTTSQTVITERQILDYDLDTIMYPDYEGVDMEYYTNACPYAIRGVFTRSIHLLASRGCPSACTFCVAPDLRQFNFDSGYKKSAGVRLRSPQSLFEEVVMLKEKYFIDSFYFTDDLFTLNEEMVTGFCDLLIKNKVNLVWGGSSKVNTVSKNSLKIMKEAGCIQLDFGVEVASDEQMHRLKKGTKIREVKAVYENCREVGVRTFTNMLINTPGETEKDLQDIIALLDEIKSDIVSINVFTPYPGTAIAAEAVGELAREEYPLLMKDPGKLAIEMPEKFRFAKHDVDLGKFSAKYMRKYNKFWRNASILLDRKYLNTLLSSRNKKNYFDQAGLLVKEFINQKF